MLGRMASGIACIVCCVLIFDVQPGSADVVSGIDGSTNIGTTSGGDGAVRVGGLTGAASFGGEGATSITFNDYGAVGEGYIGGSSGTPNSPLLKLRSDGPSSTEANSAYIGAMAAYQYTGETSATVTYDWVLTANLVEDGLTNSAFLRARTGLIAGADFYSSSHVDFYESSASVEDSMTYTKNDAGVVSEMGSISMTVNPGDVFHLTKSLQTWAGHSGAITDASNTFSGSISVSGGSISAIPEPTGGLAGLVMLGMVARRRRRPLG